MITHHDITINFSKEEAMGLAELRPMTQRNNGSNFEETQGDERTQRYNNQLVRQLNNTHIWAEGAGGGSMGK